MASEPGPAATLEIDVDPIWSRSVDWESLAARSVAATAQVAPELAHDNLLVSLVLADDDEVQALNKQWRAKDAATNVLSFPMLSREQLLRAAHDQGPAGQGPVGMLGDIILAHGVCQREAADKGVTLAAHAAHLVVHGLLHLAGYDHATGEDDAAAMEALETKALALMGLADPYCGAA